MSEALRPRRAQLLGIIIAQATAIIMIWIIVGLWLPAIGGWLAIPATPELHRADAIFVHGGNPARTQYGVVLYRQGLAPEMSLTGYADFETDITRRVEHDLGMPAQSFRYLVTTSTWSDGHEIAAAIRAHKLHSVIIVTDWWHSRRALCATEQQLGGYDVAIELAPSPSPAGPADWWRNAEIRHDVLSELVKFGYYAVRYGMNPWGC
ncbi:MAG: YdcF family protein [Kouleothrix sp.]|nr:YdcF family protein [Kouleothrix sp.]